jgi:hypothetical protein
LADIKSQVKKLRMNGHVCTYVHMVLLPLNPKT